MGATDAENPKGDGRAVAVSAVEPRLAAASSRQRRKKA